MMTPREPYMATPSLEAIRNATPAILPSLLRCDFGDLKSEVARLAEAGTEILHLDVMDGHFVPNLTYGMPIVALTLNLGWELVFAWVIPPYGTADSLLIAHVFDVHWKRLLRRGRGVHRIAGGSGSSKRLGALD